MSQLLNLNHIPHIRLHAYDSAERDKFPTHMITHMITIERIPEYLFISAYFADISQKPAYPYSFGTKEDVEKSSIQELVNFYFEQNWFIYRWLNFDYYQAWSRWFCRRKIPVLSMKTESLSTDVPNLLRTFLGIEDNAFRFDPKPSHVAKEGPNGLLYLELREAILKEYDQRRATNLTLQIVTNLSFLSKCNTHKTSL